MLAMKIVSEELVCSAVRISEEHSQPSNVNPLHNGGCLYYFPSPFITRPTLHRSTPPHPIIIFSGQVVKIM